APAATVTIPCWLMRGREPVGVPTLTVAVDVTGPDELVAVNVYVVVELGETLREPDAETVPMPGLMVTAVDPLTLQTRVEDPPGEIEVGDAVNDPMIGAF